MMELRLSLNKTSSYMLTVMEVWLHLNYNATGVSPNDFSIHDGFSSRYWHLLALDTPLDWLIHSLLGLSQHANIIRFFEDGETYLYCNVFALLLCVMADF